MKKRILLIALVAFGMLACTEKNKPEENGNSNGGDTPVEIKDGLLSGKFSIAVGKQVQFSQGNLQYKASTSTWRFALHQYDTIGANNKYISDTYDGWIDLFGWGTGNNPTLTSENNDDYADFVDWGVNKISNGGNKANVWRTLTRDEWLYLFHTRTNAALLFGLGSISGVNGLIILPDNWKNPDGVTFVASTTKGWKWSEFGYNEYDGDSESNGFSHNTYTAEQWIKMEESGAVFFPVTRFRVGSEIEASYEYGQGVYWSSTLYELARPYGMEFCWWNLTPDGHDYGGRYAGISVRLVQDVK